MKRISLCMIVKNEENLLGDCLTSVKDFVDEIIVVDTGSTDYTRDIARAFGAKIFHFKWVDDFSKARNESIKHATGDYILVLDADEKISNNDLEKMRNLVEKTEFDAASLIQRTYSNDSKSPSWKPSKDDSYKESKSFTGWFETKLLRLFRRDNKIFYQNRVHESVEKSVKDFDGKIIIAPIPIHHFGKVLSDDKVRKKGEMYLEIGKKKVDDDKSAKAYFELGVQAKQLDRTDEAIDAFEKALKINSKHTKTMINLGALYVEKGEYEKSEQTLKNALLIDPGSSDIYNNLGVVFQQQNKTGEAEEAYKKSIELNKNNLEPYQNLAGVYFSQRKIKELIETLERVIEINPKALFAYINLGAIYGKMKEYEKAYEFLEKALEIDADNIDVLLNLGIVCGMMQEYSESIEYLKKACELKPNDPALLVNLATSYEKNNQHDKAIDTLEKVLKILPQQKEEFEKKIEQLRKKGEIKEQTKEKENQMPRTKKNATLSLCMIVKNEADFIKNCLNSVKDLVDEIIVVDTGSTDNTTEIAKEYGAKIFHFRWIDDFSKARNESIKHATGDYILMLDADETFSPREIEKIRQIVEEDKYDAISFIQRNYANSSDIAGFVSKKGDLYEESADFSGWQPNPITRLFRNKAGIYYRNRIHETVDESISELDGNTLETDIPIHHYARKKDMSFWHNKGEHYLRLGKKKVEEQPDNPKAHFELGLQYQELGKLEQAEKCFRETIELKQDYAKAYHNLGSNLLKQGKFDETERYLMKGLELEPNADAYNNIGIMFAKNENYEKAVDYFKKALELNDGFAAAYKNLGITYDKLKQYKDAENALRKAISLNPKYKESIRFN